MINPGNSIRWGILACGKIARKFADDLAFVPDAQLSAVASRDIHRAEEFASHYPGSKAFGSYEEMLSSGLIDVVYVASPHGLHHTHTLLCLEAGIPVLCEKAFAVNGRQVAEMIQKAKEKNLFLMEALWTRFHPSVAKVLEIIESGKIGQIRHVAADFGFKAEYDVESRLFNPVLTGGSLMDIGIYPLFISKLLLGQPKTLLATGTMAPTGVDMNCSIATSYESGATATLFSTLAAQTDTTCTIYGSQGKILMHSRFHETFGITLTLESGEVEEFECERKGWGYSYEAEAVQADLRAGRQENKWMTHQFSQELMALLDEIRKQIGLVYPNE
ncbi:Gfo/Idh/MocA family protein [Aquirufa aurantiipilula]|uniref:Gfo/Idh/MocA family oxidoreductase n=1 Tax=Aquirufa aurantiipilula TaxID=2696561 RepID=A0ABT6BJ28_9BACT|nr:Gfo/Idh/MocA family oxidoreductase [Aquirufa aurantiipilula]MBZ1325944.1 Gfo/Idh/MocA family oxidoreductase [Aquirufa aurantiipilula]MDF5690451.1 Gfo/Idh/MocA family oxidoreductase [Aquirufa aurantiipilula]